MMTRSIGCFELCSTSTQRTSIKLAYRMPQLNMEVDKTQIPHIDNTRTADYTLQATADLSAHLI